MFTRSQSSFMMIMFTRSQSSFIMMMMMLMMMMFTRSQSSVPPEAHVPSHWLSSTRSVTGAEPLIGHDADWPRISRSLIGQAAD